MTTFADIAIGTKFVKQGQTTVYTKWSAEHAKRWGSSSQGRIGRPGMLPFTMKASTVVVPEHDATSDDILASWRKL